VEQVVDPVEASTWESRRTNVERFVDFFDMWCVIHKRKVQGVRESWEEIQGKDEIWKEGTLIVSDETIEGVYVTSPLLDEYNRHARPGEHISSLKELQLQAADQAGIPSEQVLDSSGKHCPVVKFGSHSKRAAFVPLYTGRPPKSCNSVTNEKPASQKEGYKADTGMLPKGEPATKSGMLPEGSSKDREVTEGYTKLHDYVTYEKDILDKSTNINSNKVTNNTDSQCARAREGSDPDGKLAIIEEKLLEEVQRQEHHLKTVFRESWPFASGLVDDCKDALERGDNWGAFQIRAYAQRFNPEPSSTVCELLANDEKGWQKTIKFIASARLIKARKGDVP